MEFELRELKGSDIFKVAGIIGKLDIKDELVTMFSGQSDTGDVEKRGMEIMAGLIQSIMSKLPEVEKELNGFLADLAGLKLKQVQDLPVNDYMALIKAFVEKEDLLDFFKSISSLMK